LICGNDRSTDGNSRSLGQLLGTELLDVAHIRLKGFNRVIVSKNVDLRNIQGNSFSQDLNYRNNSL